MYFTVLRARAPYRFLATVAWMFLAVAVPTTAAGPVIINHTAVDRYDRIPTCWLTVVRTMLLNYPGESHGRGLPYGLELLAAQDSRYAVNITWTGAPESPTDQHLRMFMAHWTGSGWAMYGGEEDTWTHQAAVDRINGHLAYCDDTLANPVDAFAFGWCWDMEWQSDGCDAAGWAGRVYADFAKTIYTDYWDTETTEPCLLDYLNAWATYAAAHPDSALVYTTGPVDGATGCKGYQRWLKNCAIRDWVAAGADRILFDYADILTHSDAGELYTVTWDGHVYPRIHPDNAGSYDGGQGGCHVGENGCLRLGKAAWVLLARIAGWDGLSLGDSDLNCVVDSADFAALPSCLTGPDGLCSEDCRVFDFHGDSDVDLGDVAEFLLAVSMAKP